MTITLTPSQERATQDAIRAGVVRSVDEFIETAVGALPRPDIRFDTEKARHAGARIRELRKDVRLERRGMSIRELAHIGHK
jgi:hypothetical protein